MRSYRLPVAAALPVACILFASFPAPAASGTAPKTPAITVDTAADTYDGSCTDGDCSLRDAIASAPDGGTVSVPSGVYVLSLGGQGDAEAGDLDLNRSITIRGVGDTGAFIDASGLGQRVFSVSDTGVAARLRRLTIFGARDAASIGGGVFVNHGSLSLDHVTVTGGRASKGGGLAVGATGTLRLAHSLVTGNRAGSGGGLWVRGSATVLGSAIVGNRAGSGAGVASDRGTLDLVNVTLSGNRARVAGGGLASSGATRMRSVTVAGNAAARGGGIARASLGGSRVRASNTIVAGNNAAVDGNQCAARLSSGGHNLEASVGCGFDRPTDRPRSDPRLAPLRANGGPTPTLALGTHSPALDAGGHCVPRDQRGVPRGGRCDIGAYERTLCLGAPVTIVGTDAADDLNGGREDDTVLGLGGNDIVRGSLGGDRICAGSGDDRIKAGRGDDRIAAGSGADVCDGGPGADRFHGCEHVVG